MRRTTWIFSLTFHVAVVGVGAAIWSGHADRHHTIHVEVRASRPSADSAAREDSDAPHVEVHTETVDEPPDTEPIPDPADDPLREFALEPRERPTEQARPEIRPTEASLEAAATVSMRPPERTPIAPEMRDEPEPRPEEAAAEASGATASTPAPWVDAVELSDNEPPVYPTSCVRRGVEGTVWLRLAIDADGRVTDVTVLERASRRLTEAAVTAARRWRFQPALEHGHAVASTLDIPVEFRLQ